MGRPADKDKFKSFKDLQRSQTGQPASEPERGGWTLETAGGAGDSDQGQDTHSRIATRPPAFGPMELGPEVFRDVES